MIKFPKAILHEIEVHLKQEKTQVEDRIADLKKQDPFNDVDRLSDNAASDTEAKEENNHERYQAMMAELDVKRDALISAMKRIHDGTYGFCTNCKKMIDTDRLGAMPTATLCMSCETKKKK